MIVGAGIDIAPVARFERALRDPGDSFRDALFTSVEAASCESRRYPARHFAASFAERRRIEGNHVALTHSERLAAIVVMEGAAPREVQE